MANIPNAAQRGWGDPGAANSSQAAAYRKANIVRLTVGGISVSVHKLYAPIAKHLLERHIIPTIGAVDKKADDWGYANRCVRGTGPGAKKACVKSNHSWGLAVDINATQNAQGRGDGQFPANFGAKVKHLMVRWGGDYNSTTDPMHFEFIGTPEDAKRIYRDHIAPPTKKQAAAVATKKAVARKKNPYPKPVVPPVYGKGSRGYKAKYVQWALGITEDGDFGAATEARLRQFQHTHKLDTDGLVGPKTLAALAAVTR